MDDITKIAEDLELLKTQVFKLPLDPTGMGALNQAFLTSEFDKFNVTQLNLRTGNSLQPNVNGQIIYNENGGSPQLQAMIGGVVVDLGATGGTVAGNNTEVQVNYNGVFGSSPNFTFDIDTSAFVLNSSNTAISTDPDNKFEVFLGSSSAGTFNKAIFYLGFANSTSGRFALIGEDNGAGTGGETWNSTLGSISTSNNTPTNILGAIVSFPTGLTSASDMSLYIEAKIVARRTGGTSGAAGDAAAYVRRALLKKVSGTVSVVGAIQDSFTAESQAGWDATFVVSGDDVNVQVTGATDNNIRWFAEVSYMFAGFNNN